MGGGDGGSCCTGNGVIRSNIFIFMLGSCICVVGSGSGVHSFVVVLLSSTTSTPTNTTKTTTSTTRFIATFTTQHTLNYGTSGYGGNSGIGLVVIVMVVVMVKYWW